MWGRAETGSGSGSGVVAMLPAAVRERVAAVHGAAALPELLRLYDGWAARYEQDVAALQYRAPVLAAAALAAALPGPPGAARVLDVCCGTGLVAREVPAATGLGRWGGTGRDGNRGAGAREVPVRFGARSPVPSAPRPAAAAARVRAPRRRGRQRGDAGAGTGRGAVPGAAALRAGLGTAARARRALRRRHRGGGPGRGAGAQRGRDRAAACHPARGHRLQQGHLPWVPPSLLAGGILCLTTRSNPSNLRYKAELEATLERLESQGAWEKVLAQEEDRWERATSEEESTQGTGYISGVVYIYRKCPVPWLPES
ncbi:methyltransferase-like protein 27 isoform X2 [Cuculus canorus]|uniref:methyltransferase-like protein 27 isoform X2 n=1 Tax=Cuculus canorus TaxID=55661 RepID=UPI0023AB4004|nr:methyltransferase-like protein 27 isoform X2 [Cuculus canorus]XP_053940661.1 methyltransferase-like protein 27 isoform X2 [Cuculus canorus]